MQAATRPLAPTLRRRTKDAGLLICLDNDLDIQFSSYWFRDIVREDAEVDREASNTFPILEDYHDWIKGGLLAVPEGLSRTAQEKGSGGPVHLSQPYRGLFNAGSRFSCAECATRLFRNLARVSL